MNAMAGRGEHLFLKLSFDKEDLSFVLDTGCTQTTLDKSLEAKLGKRLGTKKSNWAFYGDAKVGVYRTPKLYLNGTLLVTGEQVETGDLQLYFGRPVMGVLGMDCLRNYRIQLDFQARRIRFLDPDRLDGQSAGKAFPLTMFSRNISSHADLFSIGNVDFRIDTGFVGGDFFLKPRAYQWELNKPKPFEAGEWGEAAVKTNSKVLLQYVSSKSGAYTNRIFLTQAIQTTSNKLEAAWFSKITFADDAYTNVTMVKNANQRWPKQNWIGLQFLARHLVTFNFPKRTMYLKHTGVGPLVDTISK